MGGSPLCLSSVAFESGSSWRVDTHFTGEGSHSCRGFNSSCRTYAVLDLRTAIGDGQVLFDSVLLPVLLPRAGTDWQRVDTRRPKRLMLTASPLAFNVHGRDEMLQAERWYAVGCGGLPLGAGWDVESGSLIDDTDWRLFQELTPMIKRTTVLILPRVKAVA